MTIASDTTKQTFLGNGAQSVFSYTFLLPTASQYQLYYVDADGVAELVSQVNYSVSGVGNPAGGNLTYLRGGNPIDDGTSLTLTRAIPYTQTTELNNQGAYYPSVIEAALDRLDMQIQQLHSTLELTVRAPVTDPNMAELPPVIDRASRYAVWDQYGNLTAADGAPPESPFPSIDVLGAQNIRHLPVANPVETLSSLVVAGETISETEREFLVSFGLLSDMGAGASSPERDKVTLYAGLTAEDGTGDTWSFNTVLTMGAGATDYNSLGYELDFNNLNGDRGSTPGAAGLAAPTAYGLAITGVAAYPSTSALLITGTSGSVWNRGITFTDGIIQSSIQDFSLAERALDLQGAYDYAIDLGSSTSTQAAIQMGNAHYLRGKTTGGTERPLIGMNSSNQTFVGDLNQTTVLAGTVVVPYADNTISLGNGSFRWSEIYAANGTINTSDVRQKKDIAPLPSMTALLREVRPISFKFKQGGADVETVTEQRVLPVYETEQVDRRHYVIVDGKATPRTVKETVRRKVFDEVPVVDAKGEPVIDWTKPVLDRRGRAIREAEPVPRTYRVPRRAVQNVEVQRVVPRPGARTHYGFAAGEINDAVKKLGLGDVGVFVKGEDGIEGLRTDQLVAVLWQALREFDTRLQAVE